MKVRQVSSVAPKRIPIITVAMTQAELPSLEESLATSSIALEKELCDFLQLLEANGIANVCERYGRERTEWCPFGVKNSSIKSLITRFFEVFGKKYSLEPDFNLTEDFFAPDPITSETTWTRLRQKGQCFLIVDGISLYHSRIRRNVIDALSVIGEQAAMAVLSPFDATRSQVHSALMTLVEKECRGVMARYRSDFDPRFDILAGGTLCFNRWLQASIERTKSEIEQQQMVPERRALMQTLQPSSQGYAP